MTGQWTPCNGRAPPLRATSATAARIERALANYADPSFWGECGSGLSDAALDAGAIARHALAGTALPGRYHD